MTSAAAHVPVPRRVTKKLTELKVQEVKAILRRFKVKLAGTKGEARATNTPDSSGIRHGVQDQILQLGVAEPSSAALM